MELKQRKKSRSWDEKLDLCNEYERNGNQIISKTKYKDVNIGIWLNIQKTNYKKNKLSEDRKRKLNQLQYWRDWLEKQQQQRLKDKLSWNDKLDLCKEYEKIGNKITQSKKYKDVNIGTWLVTQKNNYNKNKLSEDRKRKLNKLKYWRNWLEQKELDWDKNMYFCMESEQNGNLLKSSSQYKGEKIGSWLDTQKKNYNKLSKERKNKLHQLKYWRNWLEQKELSWNEKLYLCLEYEKNGNKLSGTKKYKEVNIGIWLNTQKLNYKKNKLSEDRKEKLKQLKYWRNWLEKK